MSLRTITRDPFARTELVRHGPGYAGDCQWCGRPARYRYGTVRDETPGRIDWYEGVFCTVSCMRTYHGHD